MNIEITILDYRGGIKKSDDVLDSIFKRKYEGTEIYFKSIADLQRECNADNVSTCQLIKLYIQILNSRDTMTPPVSAKYQCLSPFVISVCRF